MGRRLKIVNHLSSEELKARYQTATAPVKLRRWHLLWLVSQQWYVLKSAAAVGVSYAYARKIGHQYNQHGTKTIANRRRGRQVARRALRCINSNARSKTQALQDAAPDGGIWSGPKVAQWIAHKTERQSVRAQRGWDYLKRLGGAWTTSASSPCQC